MKSMFLFFFFVLCNAGLPDVSVVKESSCNAGEVGPQAQFLSWEDATREGNGSPLQYTCLGNLMDRGVWRAQYVESKSWKQHGD